MFPIRQS